MKNEKITNGLYFLMDDKRTGIIYGVLKRLHITPWQDQFADLFQDGCLAYATAFADFPGDPRTNSRFPAYAYQKVYWRLLDELRHQQRGLALTEYSLDDQDNEPTEPLPSTGAGLTTCLDRVCLQHLLTKCTPNQQRYLIGKLHFHLTDREIATRFAVSPSAVAQWKRGLIAKARQLGYNKDELEVRK